MMILLGVDPDSKHTAIAAVSARGIHALIGGGSRADGRALCTHTGVSAELARWPGARVAVERQTRGPWSESCEGVAIVHGIWVGACELARVPYTGVLYSQWSSRWSKVAPLTAAAGGREKAYHRAAKALEVGVANEDQAAALGIAVWLAHLHGVSVPLVRVRVDTSA